MTDPQGPGANPPGANQRESRLRRAIARNWTTRMRVTAWRWVCHRIEHALMRSDIQMPHDPMSSTSRAMIIGAVVAVLVTAGAAVLSVLSPQAKFHNAHIVADKDTGALYVQNNDVLHPVLNLASAQLITNSADKPEFVKPEELALMSRGPLVGIPGAPNRTPNPPEQSEGWWSLCDNTTPAGVTTVTVIGDVPRTGEAINWLPQGSAILAGYDEHMFLIYNNKRTPIDLEDKAVTLALGIDSTDPPAVPISRGLHDALPSTPPLVVPAIADAGKPSPWPLDDPSLVTGSVIKVRPIDGADDAYYVLLTDGVQRISTVTAAIIRNAGEQNPPPPVDLSPNAILSIPVSSALNVGFYPDTAVTLIDPVAQPVTCLTWTQSRGETKPRIGVLNGRSLPLEPAALPVAVASSDPNKATADAVYVPPGQARLAQIAGSSSTAATGESPWYVADTGVRYRLVSNPSRPDESPQRALGISAAPLPAPWSIINLLPAGPALSKQSAMLSLDCSPA